MTSFRDAIAWALRYEDVDGEERPDRHSAAAVLAMPEMEAIRKALATRALSHLNVYKSGYPPHQRTLAYVLESWELPESVIDWVLGEGQ